MGFLTPISLLFATLSIPILVMYMLKLRRRDVLVSSTLLWQRLLRDREANAPWQRLRRNLLMLLQLLILALLTLALARPFVPMPTVVSGSVVILLDASASMQARDVEPSRFDAARRAVQEIVEGSLSLGSSNVATIIAVGSQPQVLASATNDRALLRRVLEDAAPTNGPADWEAAFALAAAGLRSEPFGREGSLRDLRPSSSVVIISDGALPEALSPLPGEVRFVGVGGGGDNLAITALATREGGRCSGERCSGPQAFLRVVNYSDANAEPLVEFSADGILFDARRLLVPAHGHADLTLTDLPYDLHVLQAHLSVEDALPLDNTAWAVHIPPVSGRVLLISTGNLFLERALGALPGVELVRLAPGQPLPAEPYDLYVYDSVITGTLPTGNLWLIGPGARSETARPGSQSSAHQDGFPIEVGGFFTNTAITRTADDDPLLRYVDLRDVHILRARMVVPPPEARVLIEAEGGPLLFVAERPEERLAVLTFDLHDSDLPLQIAFPILTANLADWLLPGGAARLPATVQPGDPVPIQPDPEATEVMITAPDGTHHAFPVGEESPVFAATGQPGVYLIGEFDRSGNVLQSAVFAVNLFDEAESNIAPRDVVRVGQSPELIKGREVAAAMRKEQGRHEFWPWLAVAALGVLVVEWWAYQRGTLRTRGQRGV